MRLALLPLVFLLAGGSASAGEWFVAPDGNDAWSGTLVAPNAAKTDGPFATLAHARDAVRGGSGARSVSIRAGVYELPEGLIFSVADSGTAEAPVLWRAHGKEQPVLVGGRQITGWKPWKDHIVQADLNSQGMKGTGFRQLLFAGARQPLARYPNFDPANPYGGGWAYAAGENYPMYANREGEDLKTLSVKPEDWRTWARPEEVEVFIFPRFNWWNNILPVKALDPEKHTVTTTRGADYAMRPGDRYYFRGAREELDAPGEWYLDRPAGLVYFWPPAPIESAPVVAPTALNIIKGDGVQYLTLRGLRFEGSREAGISFTNSSHCRVIGCTLSSVGDFSGTGVSMNGGVDDGVIGCDISYTGSNGISLGGGDRITLTPAGHFADNCYIHHVGVSYKQGAGVSLSGVGQRVSHCLIHDTPRFGIMFTGNNHVLEYNHLRHLALETEDVGATYCGGRDWISPRGTVIRYNYIHDILGYGWNGKWTSPYFAWGIYLDDNSGGVDVIGNIVARCGRSLFHGHSARDCRVENNIFIEGGLRQWEFNGWTTGHKFWTDHFPSMVKGYESVAGQPAWQGMRGMEVHPKDIPDAEGRVMSGNVFAHNIIWWKNPDAAALNVVAFNSERNAFDHNLYWHQGLSSRTGQHKAGAVIGGNLAPNPNFQEGESGKMPKDWNWQIFTPTSSAKIVDLDGVRALRIEAAFNPAKPRDNSPIIVSRPIALKQGTSYRLHARMKSEQPEAHAALMLQFYLPPKEGQKAFFWSSSPNNTKLTPAWQDVEFVATIPGRGEKGWHEQMKELRIRLDWPEKEGALFVSQVSLEETETKDEWQSWQDLGGDRHSVIADPKFTAPEKDDYTLAADSPAWALGFQRITVEKIGPYAGEERASWPIAEAEGAREHPVK